MKPIKEPTDSQRKERDREAEIAVFDALLATNLEGNLFYDVRAGKQIDMYLEIPGEWRGAVEVKGGHHMVKDGIFYRREANGNLTMLKDSPLDQAVARAMAIRDALKARLGGPEWWINAVLVLPSMAVEDPEITKCAADSKVNVIWGAGNEEQQVLRFIQDNPDRNPPDELDMAAAAAALLQSKPPAEWLSRRAAEKDSEDSTVSADLLALSNNPALPARADAPVSAMYKFVIYNYGTMHINVPDSETLAPHNDVSVLNTEPDDAAPTADPVAAVPGVPGVPGDCDDDHPPVIEPDPFVEVVVDDGFDDADPFS